MEKALREQPEYVVFNGSVGAIAGDNALRAEVGETVRMFVGNGGPNLVSSFHVIGEIFDRVFIEGGTAINRNVQTTLIPPGGATIVEFKVEVPGTLILVDHAIFRAFNKGALGMLKVDGAPQTAIYSGKQADTVYLPEGGAVQSVSEKPPVITAQSPAERVKFGERVFSANCIACHQPTGVGIPGVFPPLAGSDFLNADKKRAIGVVSNGLEGQVTVNGQKFANVMPKLGLSDEDIANVLSFVYDSWGNSKQQVTPQEVRAVREAAAH
jgi:nitrite reductase (NO-forming)